MFLVVSCCVYNFILCSSFPQVLNQNFQGNMLSNSTSQAAAAAAAAAGIPFNPFITPNFTINNGLMLQHRSGGFKLTVGEDGRLILQHDPTLNQDLQSQLLLQSIFGLNGGLVLQPSMDQQVCWKKKKTKRTINIGFIQVFQLFFCIEFEKCYNFSSMAGQY